MNADLFRKKHEECGDCPYYKNTFIQPQIRPDAKLMFVGEQPGDEELEQGDVFIGQSGQKLNSMCKQAGIDREAAHVTNTVKCYSDEKPPKDVVEKCADVFLRREIQFVKPELVVALGDYALSAMTGSRGIKRMRGMVTKIRVGKTETKLLATYHPSYTLRSPRFTGTVIADLKQAKRVLDGKKDATGDWYKYKILTKTQDVVAKLESMALDKSLLHYGIDTETTSLSSIDGEILVIGIAESEDRGFAIILYDWEPPDKGRDIPTARRTFIGNRLHLIKQSLNNLLKRKTGILHNAKFDFHFFRDWSGIDPCKIKFEDTMLLAYLVQEEGEHGLEHCAAIYTDIGPAYKKKILGKDLKGRKDGRLITPEKLAEYCVADACAQLRVFNALWPMVNGDPDLLRAYLKVQKPLVPVLCAMERRGIKVNKSRLTKLMEKYEARKNTSALVMRKACGKKSFNPASVPQLNEVIEDMGIQDLDTTTNYQAVAQAVKKVDGKEERFLSALLDFRDAAKAFGTAKGLMERLDKKNRLHTTFGSHFTVTMRLASRDPNLQNQAKDLEWRRVFVARKGYKLISIDYSQIELRLLAQLSGDRVMEKDFDSGVDLHGYWASKFFPGQYEKEKAEKTKLANIMRDMGKTWNFAIPFGGDPFTIFNRLKEGFGDDSLLKVTMEDVEENLKKYFARYKALEKWLKNYPKYAEKEKVITLPFGNKRRLFDQPGYLTQREKSEKYRQALNAPPQGTAASITNTSLIAVFNRFKELGIKAHVLLQIHDQLIFEAKNSVVIKAARIAKVIMQRPIKEMGDRRYPVEVEIGDTWGTTEKVEISV